MTACFLSPDACTLARILAVLDISSHGVSLKGTGSSYLAITFWNYKSSTMRTPSACAPTISRLLGSNFKTPLNAFEVSFGSVKIDRSL